MMKIRLSSIQVLRIQSDIGLVASMPSRSAPTDR
jgi:hypothetical protein